LTKVDNGYIPNTTVFISNFIPKLIYNPSLQAGDKKPLLYRALAPHFLSGLKPANNEVL
jgi:hypothetical protein